MDKETVSIEQSFFHERTDTPWFSSCATLTVRTTYTFCVNAGGTLGPCRLLTNCDEACCKKFQCLLLIRMVFFRIDHPGFTYNRSLTPPSKAGRD